jgi:sporulation protein YlmC with PRC-barrel domain
MKQSATLARLLATTAFAAAMSVSLALAQQEQSQSTKRPAAESEATGAVKAGQMTSDQIIGMDVRNEQNENIGTIDALVFDDKNQIVAGVVSVGGFLGMGAKSVAVEWDRFEFRQAENEMVAVVSATKEQLEAAPAYDKTASTAKSSDRLASDQQSAAPEQRRTGEEQQAGAEDASKRPADQTAAGETQAAQAECQVVNQDVDQEIAESPERRDAYGTTLVRDLRQMRNTAIRLNDYGQTDACQEVVEAMRDIIDNPAGYQEGQVDARASAEAAGQAVPMTEAASQISANDLIGMDVRGSDGKTIGEVDDVVIGAGDEKSYLIIAYGGFLGLGEDVTAIPFDRASIAPDVDVVFVQLTEAELDSAPTYKRADDSWRTSDKWRTQTDEYYSSLQ